MTVFNKIIQHAGKKRTGGGALLLIIKGEASD
jgi:hypothetical protein